MSVADRRGILSGVVVLLAVVACLAQVALAKDRGPYKYRSKNWQEMATKAYQDKVIADETVEETHTPEENKDGYLSDEEVNKIWREHMHDFVPEDMTTFQVNKVGFEAFMEDINH